MLESGTLNAPGIVGLGFGIKFIESFGVDNNWEIDTVTGKSLTIQ